MIGFDWKRYLPLLLVVIVFMGGMWWIKSAFFKTALITVSGMGETSVKATKANFVFTALTADKDAVMAIDTNNSVIDNLIRVVKSTLGNEVSIKRGGYQVTPQADQFVVVTGVNVESKNLSDVAGLVKNLYKSGATTVSSISYEASDKYLADASARKLAMAEAKKNAQALAKSAGKRLGRMVSLLEDESVSGGTVSDVTTKNDLEAMIVSKKVNVVYEIW